MFRVFRKGDRLLISGRDEDLSLIGQGWAVVGEYDRWERAFSAAVRLAEREELLVEWYLEEEVASARRLKAVRL
ncbi:MAG: hypothetical protein ACP5I3_11050 [Thermoproteus sp.]|jgi:hypothetical protein